ncbi:MAG: SDR family NAD(P)-dependent oxidoreductase [Anaerolineae bacterium]
MRALVTGGAGFIGSHLVDALLASGWEVIVLDDLSTGRRENLAHLASEPRLRLVVGDVCDAALVESLVRQCRVVYHLAAVVGVTHVLREPLRGLHTNVHGTDAVLAAALRHGARVCLASSSEVYGESEATPFVEDSPSVLGPTWVSRWSYATAKALDEHLAFAYAQQGLAVSIVRYFNAYGPRLHPSGYGSVVARLIGQALAGEPLTVYGDGQQTRSFTYVADTVKGTVLAGTEQAALGQVFNIGSEDEVTIAELARAVLATTGSASPIRYVPYAEAYGSGFAEPRRRRPSIAKARRLLGFAPCTSLAEGLAETARWFLDRQ